MLFYKRRNLYSRILSKLLKVTENVSGKATTKSRSFHIWLNAFSPSCFHCLFFSYSPTKVCCLLCAHSTLFYWVEQNSTWYVSGNYILISDNNDICVLSGWVIGQVISVAHHSIYTAVLTQRTDYDFIALHSGAYWAFY